MILPLGDAPNPRGTPFVTYALVAVNCAVYLLVTLPLSVRPPDLADPTLAEYLRVVAERLPSPVPISELLRHTSAYDLFVFSHGFRPAAPALTDLFTSMFLHGGFVHLFGNMLFLWIYGDNVEHRLGGPGFLLAYLGTGVAATLFHALFDRNSPLPMVGASGAISGVLGFYFVFFPRNMVRLFVVLFPFILNVVVVPARLVLGLYLVVNNLLPFILTRGLESGGVAYGAHIGGFLAGLGAAWLMDRRAVTARPREYRPGRGVAAGAATGDGPARALARAITAGDFAGAAPFYFALDADATRRVLAPEDSLALGDWLAEHGHPQAALTVYRRHLRDYPSGPGAAEAHVGAGLVQLQHLGQPTSAYQHFVEALQLEPPPETAIRARAGLDAIAAVQKFQVRARAR